MINNASRSKSYFAELALLFVAMMWGVNAPAVKLGLHYLPPQTYNTTRLMVGSLVALIALGLSGHHRWPSRADWWAFCRVSAFGFFVFQLFFSEGILRTTSGNASFVLCLLPLMVLLLNKLYGFETITRGAVLGIACSLSGIALIVFGVGQGLELHGRHLLGALLLLGSQAGYAYYTVFSKELLTRYSTYQVTAYTLLIATTLIFAVSAPEMMSVHWAELPSAAWLSAIFSGVFALCLGNFLWIWGSGVIGTSRVAIFNNLSPIFAVISAYFMLGESFGPLQIVGGAFVFLGVHLTRNRPLWFSRQEKGNA